MIDIDNCSRSVKKPSSTWNPCISLCDHLLRFSHTPRSAFDTPVSARCFHRRPMPRPRPRTNIPGLVLDCHGHPCTHPPWLRPCPRPHPLLALGPHTMVATTPPTMAPAPSSPSLHSLAMDYCNSKKRSNKRLAHSVEERQGSLLKIWG